MRPGRGLRGDLASAATLTTPGLRLWGGRISSVLSLRRLPPGSVNLHNLLLILVVMQCVFTYNDTFILKAVMFEDENGA